MFRKRRKGLDAASSEALIEILTHPKFELIPLGSALRQAQHLPPGAPVAITASPTKPIERTVEFAVELQAHGFAAVPHLAARMVADRAHLSALLDSLAGGGVTRVFVIGGDAADPGRYPDALSLLQDMEQIGHSFVEIGIGCYPEGHPLISGEDLLRALQAKAPYAHYMTTQMCFDAGAITEWVAARRADGLNLPVHVGIPGVAQLTKLIALAARIGVGDSRRFLAKNRKVRGRLVRPGGYAPGHLLDRLGRAVGDAGLGVEAVHLYTFNQVQATEEWRRRYLAMLQEDLTAGRSDTPRGPSP